MTAKDILYSSYAREKMMVGVDKLANAVKVTLGPKGRHVIFDKLYSGPRSTKDGVTVAKEIFLRNNFENMGAQFLKGVAIKSGELAGDGTTTSTVLGQAIMREGLKAISSGVNPMDLKRGIEMAVKAVVADLQKHSQPIQTSEEIRQVATISANGDTDIGNMITTAYDEMGRDGHVTIMEGRKLATDLEIVNGITFNNGFIDPYFVNNPQKNTCELENCLVFFYEQNFVKAEQLEPVIKEAYKIGQPLLIVANDIKGSALALQVANATKKIYMSCSVKAPSYDQYRNQLMEDMTLLTGGQLVSIAGGNVLANHISKDIFGHASKVIVSVDKTTIIGGKGDPVKIKERRDSVRKLIQDLDNSHEINEEYRNHLTTRNLNFNGMAVIRVGGLTEVEMKERYDRYDDSLNATRAALAEGILPGGGVALFKSISILEELKPLNSDVAAGIRVIKQALSSPLMQISANAAVIGVEKDLLGTYYNYGYDAQNGVYGDMFDMGIIDPTKVVRVALENAASVAGIMLTTETMITFDEEIKLPNGPQQYIVTGP